jgi:oligopeptide transport system ATP-binding protein
VAETILAVENLTTVFRTGDGEVRAADGVSFEVRAGEALGVVGESGSGKTQLFLATMGLLARNGSSTGAVRYRGRDLLSLRPAELNAIRGARIAMIFQDPMTSLNPYLTVARQLTEVLVEHRGLDGAAARARAIAMLERVGIPRAAERIDRYPHEFSGGMRQRVMIAAALLCEPDLLIADEPTTALDVTIQAQILRLLADLRRDFGMAIVLVTHDLGVVAGLCDRLLVMYAGRVVEEGPVEAVFAGPRHPYTQGLLRSMPRLDDPLDAPLRGIEGTPPDLSRPIPGCPFVARCDRPVPRCATDRPPLVTFAAGRAAACHVEAPA